MDGYFQEVNKMVNDDVAKKLEAKGLWRRASTRWLYNMSRYGLTDEQRAWIRQRRGYCLSRLEQQFIQK